MDAIDSDSRVTAQLSRLIGLAASQLYIDLCEAALRAAGALCNFNAGSDARTRCLSAAAAVAIGSSRVSDIVHQANRCACNLRADGRDVFRCAVEVSLTLLEGAAIQAGPPPEALSGDIYVTGQHRWVLSQHWVHAAACSVALFDGQRVMNSTLQSPADLQRKVVMTAALTCALFPTRFSEIYTPARSPRGRRLLVQLP